MKKVLKVSDLIQTEEKKESKGIEFTCMLTGDFGWDGSDIYIKPNDSYISNIIYLGKCTTDGDMFAVCLQDGNICIYKGHLNDGTY